MLDNPPYNLVIHTSPVQDPTNDHYHWHIEFMPETDQDGRLRVGNGFTLIPRRLRKRRSFCGKRMWRTPPRFRSVKGKRLYNEARRRGTDVTAPHPRLARR